MSRELEKQISQLDKQIDCQISEFNINIIKSSIGMGGVIDKQSFWKMKKLIAPRSKEIPCSLLDKHDNLLTDPETIRNEYLSEFKHRLRARDIKTELKWYESFQNDICYLRVDAAKSNNSPEFSILELKQVIRELKTGKSMDPTGMVREIFKKAGDGFLNSVLDMMNSIKTSEILPLEWSKTWITTIKKKKRSFKKLKNYRDIFLVPLLSIIFEKLLKNRINQSLQQNISKFQNGGMKGKGVVDSLFILRATVNHAKYLNKELLITFYDIEKCFDSLWLENCINSLWDLGVKDDTLFLIYLMNTKASVTIKTPMGDTYPLILSNLVKQGTVLGLVINNCSLDRFSKESFGYNFGSVGIKPLQFVDDIANPSSSRQTAVLSNKLLENIQHEKRVNFSAEKCELLKINSICNDGLLLNAEVIKSVRKVRYLGDVFSNKGDNSELCKDNKICIYIYRHDKIKGTITELFALSKGIKFGTKQIESLLLLYKTVFLPRLIYNCEAWSGLTTKNLKTLKSSQLHYLRKILEVSKGVPSAALYLELGVLPISFEIELKQLLYLKCILDREYDDPVRMVYHKMLKYKEEINWANDVIGLRKKYNLPLSDENIKNMQMNDWKSFVKSVIYKEAFMELQIECSYNKKTSHISYEHFQTCDYLTSPPPKQAKLIFKAKTGMLDIKVNFKNKYANVLKCPLCLGSSETFSHIFICPSGLWFPKVLRGFTLESLNKPTSLSTLKKLGRFLERYLETRKLLM